MSDSEPMAYIKDVETKEPHDWNDRFYHPDSPLGIGVPVPVEFQRMALVKVTFAVTRQRLKGFLPNLKAILNHTPDKRCETCKNFYVAGVTPWVVNQCTGRGLQYPEPDESCSRWKEK